MPDWINHSFSYNTETPSSSYLRSSYFSVTMLYDIRQQYEDYKQEQERIEDRKKYPLFFWKQTCKPIKEKV